ncbi:MAG: hypothetical protein EAZ99_01070 [Alphaproteobacteria bacterium]|nr:hypothetical protein [Alphaproteobacteria bacterium]TAD91948.1 MAG: hypothetical protein EAZ99_01070 [Alphaproteobacteria bacterium]
MADHDSLPDAPADAPIRSGTPANPSSAPSAPRLSENGRVTALEREARRAAALRENLKRRKAWARGVAAGKSEPS